MHRTRQSPPSLSENANPAVRAAGVSDREVLAKTHFERAPASGCHLPRSILSSHCGRNCQTLVFVPRAGPN
jgi:hypothetical protein